MYYVIYFDCIGYNIFTEEELPFINMNDAYIEYNGSKEECINYIENI
jgi:hypothetical protein